MSTRKQAKAVQNLIEQIWQLTKHNPKKEIQWLLRSLLVNSKSSTTAGFVLPTTVMLLLVMTIVIAALIVRTSSRTNQVFAQRQENYISNAASPAIDRAKSKLEYLFSNTNSGIPNGVPGQSVLQNLILDPPGDDDIYTLGGETRLDLNNDGNADNAWAYPVDTNGDGQNDATIAYSIIGQVPANQNDLNNQRTDAVNTRANNLHVRNRPVFDAANSISSSCPQGQTQEEGWFISNNNSSLLRKNFQINAVVIPDNRTTATSTAYSTLELQQDRQFDRGNKWGAWFRNDIELGRPPVFNWNGAMHTEGSIFVAENADNFTAFLISSPSSCVYSRTASEITTSEITNDQNQVQFQGQIVNGSMSTNTMVNTRNRFHFLNQNNQPVIDANNNLTYIAQASDSISNSSNVSPSDIALNPVKIFTEDKSEANNVTNWTTVRDSNWKDRDLVSNKRIHNQREPKPYLDDTYRADNRYGPKPTYGKDSSVTIPAGTKIGEPIPSARTNLISNDPISGGQENLGLDGYWERRARLDGLRVIVGQRLELSNPLAPPTGTVSHEARQRRALRDNLAAVQATAIYHQANRAAGNVQDFPITCLATTVHPGTAETLKRSATFDQISFTKPDGSTTEDITYSDFFYGWGTNGWEYNVPDPATFPNPAMLRALNNLANFAGDPFGAFPAQQDNSSSKAVAAAGSVIHPYPQLTQYGDFSNLRRAIRNLNASGYANLSIADQSYLHTAGCSLGMLANQIKVLQDFNYANNNALVSNLDRLLKSASGTLDQAIQALTDENARRLARTIYLKEQVERDRKNGTGYSCSASKFGSTHTTGGAGSGLAKLCPTGVRYRALYYIFPATKHDEYEAARTGDNYIRNALVNAPTPSTDFYKPIDGNTSATYDASTDATALESIRLKPRTIGGANPWKLLPTVVSSPGTAAPNDRQNSLIKYRNTSGTETVYRVPFKDAALFNGREMMNVRVLDFDLDLLRRNTINSDHGLPQKGIVYAFREDAVREDGIARPAGAAGSNMNASTPQDPPITSTNGISTKPVDFLPDPDRRPYGFRLRNGSDLTRTSLALSDANNNRGLSFISDNPVYIQGNFNLHSTDGSNNNLEEFEETLVSDYSNFYDRETLETQFADPSQDRWRFSEIISDALTILSSNFCDGSIQDSFTTAGTGSSATVSLTQYGCGSSSGETSYLNQNRPSSSVSDWRRENLFDPNSPILIDANGSPVRTTGSYSNSYYNFSNAKPLTTPINTWVNTIIVSGTVPSRANQFNGGLHNFPRFLENWSGTKALHLAGALIQLNFSTYATAPFDQEGWEPGSSATTTDVYPYYTPPKRLWGYDVGLLKASAGPVARRFVSANNTRSEYYRELPIDDPYIRNLRCAKRVGETTRIDTSASCPLPPL